MQVVMDTLPVRMALLEQHMQSTEDDINNLWSAYRGDDPDRVRRERPPRGKPNL